MVLLDIFPSPSRHRRKIRRSCTDGRINIAAVASQRRRDSSQCPGQAHGALLLSLGQGRQPKVGSGRDPGWALQDGSIRPSG